MEQNGACFCMQEELEPIYYARCSNYYPEFVNTGSYHYVTTHACGWKTELDVTTEEDAEKVVQEMNKNGLVCPKCGNAGKLRAMTNFEIYNEEQLLKRMNYLSLHTG